MKFNKTPYSHIPFSPKKLPFFYGWVVLFLGAFGILMSIPGQTMGVSVFTDFLMDAMNMSRINLSLAYMVGTIGSSLLLSQAGEFYDRFGARITLFLSGLLLGFVLLFLSQIDRVAGFFSQMIPFGFAFWAFFLMCLGFFLLRFSGQGVMTMVSRSTVMKWFDKRRGLAAGLMGVVTSFGFAYAPKVLDGLIGQFSWRGAWQWMALFCGFIFALLALIFQRDNPTQCGMKPDSLKEIHVFGKVKKRVEGQDCTLKEAKKQPILWIFSITLAIWALHNTAFTFHVISLFDKVGIEKSRALSIFFPISIISVSTRFLVSAISDHIRLESLFLYFLLSMLLSAFSQLFVGQTLFWYLLIGGMGLAGGAFGSLVSITWVRLFGKKHLGAISGFAMSWIVAGSAIGPYFFSLSEKLTGLYNLGAYFTLILCSLLFIAVLWLSKRSEVVTVSTSA